METKETVVYVIVKAIVKIKNPDYNEEDARQQLGNLSDVTIEMNDDDLEITEFEVAGSTLERPYDV